MGLNGCCSCVKYLMVLINILFWVGMQADSNNTENKNNNNNKHRISQLTNTNSNWNTSIETCMARFSVYACAFPMPMPLLARTLSTAAAHSLLQKTIEVPLWVEIMRHTPTHEYTHTRTQQIDRQRKHRALFCPLLCAAPTH